ncbi:hypothetical protein [Sporocytophaga myxococcoides]|uniref:hypothetical protein n=1 Tax=Sporocytophaga myxococcoides TaxID=153721 RepID=UPI0004010287|nr:hypothetical protein [Sporocytophaga myxococcoides]
MNILDALIFLGELLALTPDRKSDKRSILEKSNSIVQKLITLFITLAIIFLIVEINFKYLPYNLCLTPLLVSVITMSLSIGFSILLNRVYNIQYTYSSFIVLIITMALFLSSLTFTINRMADQKLFKIIPYSQALKD